MTHNVKNVEIDNNLLEDYEIRDHLGEISELATGDNDVLKMEVVTIIHRVDGTIEYRRLAVDNEPDQGYLSTLKITGANNQSSSDIYHRLSINQELGYLTDIDMDGVTTTVYMGDPDNNEKFVTLHPHPPEGR